MTEIPSGTNSSTILNSHLLDKKLNENELNNLSKNQLKKIKKKEKWLAHKSEKRYYIIQGIINKLKLRYL